MAEGREERAARLTAELREHLAGLGGTVMIFLGAGLSFGVARQLGRGSFETPPPLADDSRFPSWPMLIDRMSGELQRLAGEDDDRRGAYERFMRDHDALDAAQLYRLEVD